MQLSNILGNIKTIGAATFDAFFEDRIFKLSGALAYYTILAISPTLIIIISVAGLLYKKEAIEHQVFAELKALLGTSMAQDIHNLVLNSSFVGQGSIGLISGIVIMFVASTAAFAEIQDSLNLIWKVKAKPKRGWLKLIRDRILSFSVILTLAFIMLVSMLLNAVVKRFGRYFYDYLPVFDETYDFIFSLIDFFIGFLMPTIIFTLMFKILPDVKIKWKPAFIGGVFTAVLFTIGQILIGLYFRQFQPGLNYGSAGSIITLLLWVYYTSIILYLGALFTRIYAELFSTGIQPSDNAVYLKISEEKHDVRILPTENKQNDD